jgi:hypothetical protein
LKQRSYEKLVEFVQKGIPEADIEFVKSKINNFRTNFRKELRKVESSKTAGKGADEICEPTLWYYKLLLFLCDTETVHKSESNVPDSRNEDRNLEEEVSIFISLYIE